MGQPTAPTQCSVSPAGATVDSFVAALGDRDFARLASSLDEHAQARLLLPRGHVDVSGRDEISGLIGMWFGAANRFEVLSSDRDEIGGRQRASWRFRLSRSEGVSEVIEQHAYFNVGRNGIEQLDLMCSGFHVDAAAGRIQSAIHRPDLSNQPRF